MTVYLNAVAQGILWGLMGLGMYITFRILNFADLTSEASFTTGAVVAVALMTKGYSPLVACVVALIAGMLAGLLTGMLMVFFEIPPILASIISLTGLYSINLRILGSGNESLRRISTIFDYLTGLSNQLIIRYFIIGIVISALFIGLLYYFFLTDRGQALIATGDNELMAKSLGIPVSKMKLLGLMMANGLIGLSGSLIAQDNGFADITMGTGTVVIALSSIVLSEVLFPQLTLLKRFITIFVGAIIYRLLLVSVLQLGFSTNDFRLISAFFLALFLALPVIKRKLMNSRKVD